MNALERTVRAAWRERAAHIHFGVCDVCQRSHDEDGQPLLVARQPRRRVFECLRCFDARSGR